MPTQDGAIAIVAQMAATLLGAPRDSGASSVGTNMLETAVRVANQLYDKVVESRPLKPDRGLVG
jgi:hypothetical protein